MQGSGAKYSNGNYKKQQSAYNDTKKGRELIVNANRLRRQLQAQGKLKKGSGKDAGHYAGSTTQGGVQGSSENRARRPLKKPKNMQIRNV